MKAKFSVLIAVLCWTAAAFGQDSVVYQSVIGDHYSIWCIYLEDRGALNAGTDVRETYDDDTITIDSLTYHIVSHNVEDSRTSNVTTFFDDRPAYLRENDNHSKLYLRMKWHVDDIWNHTAYDVDYEVLIMDLGLEVGDTLDTHGWSDLRDWGIDSPVPTIRIDSIYYKDNRKILQTNYYLPTWQRVDTLFFIEGIGPSLGLFYPRRSELCVLNCFFKDDVHVYHGKDYYANYKMCIVEYLGDKVDEPAGDMAYRVSPNPTQDIVRIEFPSASSYGILLQSANGKSLFSGKSQGESLNVDLRRYPKGMYYVTITDKDNASTIKVIKL